MKYSPTEIEPKWQKVWDEQQLYKAVDNSEKPKYYSLDMFPYPSGDLHIGHWYAFTPPDIHARYMRMNGYNVMQPIGFDAFGLPAENAAIKRNLNPNHWTQQNIAGMLSQFRLTGISFDMSRVINTSAPEYYKWTQWMFLQFYKHGLAYRKKARVNWCEYDQTVLANEQVIDGLCWRCDNPVVQKELEQWFFKITAYGDQLLQDLDTVDWPETTKRMQRNWIGKSVGATVHFNVKLADKNINQQEDLISVFTTRPDTIYGVTYLVLAPDHHLVPNLITPDRKQEAEQYIEQTQRKAERQRLATADQKTGVFTGSFATHPLTGKPIPIWIADYVLSTYGTGAVMGVPAHDKRDNEFASNFHLPIIQVIDNGVSDPFGGEGVLVNSESYTGMSSSDARTKIVEDLSAIGAGSSETTYRFRDWLISRQRYWGPPIPMIDCPKCGITPVPEEDLPVVLPQDVDFMPKGKPPLATNEAFMNVSCPVCGGNATRVAETLDTFVDSSWYFLRFADPHNPSQAFSKESVAKWLPVDIYIGGAEHTVLHLLYSRFFTKALRDMGYLEFSEPFKKLRHQGMILGPDHQKMSKSKGNVVNPDDLVEQFGADAVRMQLVFLGPHDQGGPWELTGIHGAYRFLNKVWQEQHKRQRSWAQQSDPQVQQAISIGIAKVGEDIQQFKFNTAVAELMKIINSVNKAEMINQKDWESFIITLSPFAPYLAEELWHLLGHNDSIHTQKWPEVKVSEKNKLVKTAINVQVNGKYRATIEISAQATEQAVLDLATKIDAVGRHIAGKQVLKHIYIPGKVINIITG